MEQYPLIKKSPKEIAFCLEALFSLNIHLEMSKSSLCFYLMLQQTCCMHSLASKLGCYVSIHMLKYQEFIQVNLRISKVPSYWRWSPLLKSCSFSDEPPYSRTPLIWDSRVGLTWHLLKIFKNLSFRLFLKCVFVKDINSSSSFLSATSRLWWLAPTVRKLKTLAAMYILKTILIKGL